MCRVPFGREKCPEDDGRSGFAIGVVVGEV